MEKRGFSTYKKINTMGMSQVELILTVYRGAIGYLDNARANFDEGSFPEGRAACEKARKCIVHLYTTLNMEKGGAISMQLGQLYVYMIQQIDLAIASKSCKILGGVMGILGTVKEAWEGLKDQESHPVHDSPSAAQLEQNKNHDQPEKAPVDVSPSTNGDRNRLTFSA